MSILAIKKAKQVHLRHPALSFPLDMEWLASVEGCECITWPFIEPVKEVKQGRWIGIALELDITERRFLIAHALGHHLMHCGNQLTFCSWQKSSLRQQENNADCCAAHILMPEEELIKVENLPLCEIIEYFGVPEDLCQKRMSDFATAAETERWQNNSFV